VSLSRSWALVLVAAVAFLALAGAVGFQYGEAVEPCPLCILQRYAYAGVLVFALLAAALQRPPALRWATLLLTLAAALAGLGVAARHSWTQWFPSEASTCSFRFTQTINELPLGPLFPAVFAGHGDCGDTSIRLLGLTMPVWSLLCLAGLTAALLFVAAWRRWPLPLGGR